MCECSYVFTNLQFNLTVSKMSINLNLNLPCMKTFVMAEYIADDGAMRKEKLKIVSF